LNDGDGLVRKLSRGHGKLGDAVARRYVVAHARAAHGLQVIVVPIVAYGGSIELFDCCCIATIVNKRRIASLDAIMRDYLLRRVVFQTLRCQSLIFTSKLEHPHVSLRAMLSESHGVVPAGILVRI